MLPGLALLLLLPDHSSDNENFDYSETPLDRAQQAYESKQQKYNAAYSC